ncbi:uncharacterized protein VTP21DRAFT_11381 [Calcarisporiella thermophila]|uniref:uncharacterized protein n=1 Tax=Calcarisporiella thermophila TaxID=911321 RepID=UPI0037422ACC
MPASNRKLGPETEYIMLKEIGDGSFGSVLQAQNRITGDMVAIKKMKKKFTSWYECTHLREYKALMRLKGHPNIIQLFDAYYNASTKELSLVMEYMEGNLYQLINERKDKKNGLLLSEIQQIIGQVLSGLAHMHNKGIFHRDLKPENLLVACAPPTIESSSKQLVVKIADFGLARDTRNRLPYTEYVSTRWYRAPEVLLRSPFYTPAIDMWAVGTILAELLTLQPLFPGHSEADQLWVICQTLGNPEEYRDALGRQIGGGEWKEGIKLARNTGFSFPQTKPKDLRLILPHAPNDLITVLERLLKYDPKLRPNAENVLRYQFFTNSNICTELNNTRWSTARHSLHRLAIDTSLLKSEVNASFGRSRSRSHSSTSQGARRPSLRSLKGVWDFDLPAIPVSPFSFNPLFTQEENFEPEELPQKDMDSISRKRGSIHDLTSTVTISHSTYEKSHNIGEYRMQDSTLSRRSLSRSWHGEFPILATRIREQTDITNNDSTEERNKSNTSNLLISSDGVSSVLAEIDRAFHNHNFDVFFPAHSPRSLLFDEVNCVVSDETNSSSIAGKNRVDCPQPRDSGWDEEGREHDKHQKEMRDDYIVLEGSSCEENNSRTHTEKSNYCSKQDKLAEAINLEHEVFTRTTDRIEQDVERKVNSIQSWCDGQLAVFFNTPKQHELSITGESTPAPPSPTTKPSVSLALSPLSISHSMAEKSPLLPSLPTSSKLVREFQLVSPSTKKLSILGSSNWFNRVGKRRMGIGSKASEEKSAP